MFYRIWSYRQDKRYIDGTNGMQIRLWQLKYSMFKSVYLARLDDFTFGKVHRECNYFKITTYSADKSG